LIPHAAKPLAATASRAVSPGPPLWYTPRKICSNIPHFQGSHGVSGVTADTLKDLGSLIPYWAFMLATAGGFYKAMVFVGGHFPEDFKKDLSLWLDGVYDTSWSSHFCRMFDAVFGARHLSVKRFVR
jgi:hypothetical protein